LPNAPPFFWRAGPRSGPPNATDPVEDKLFRDRFAAVAATGKTKLFGYVYTS
jgi:hypothetical protein